MGLFDYVNQLHAGRIAPSGANAPSGLEAYKKALGGVTSGVTAAAKAPTPDQWGYVHGRSQNLDQSSWQNLTADAKQGLFGLLNAFGNATWSSGWRDPSNPAEAGGNSSSPHRMGIATDLVVPDGNYAPLVAWAQAHGGTTLIHDAGSGLHLHINWK